MIKLYKILLEQSEQPKLLSPEQMKAPPSAFKHLAPLHLHFAAPEYALVPWKSSGSEQALTLIHVDKFKKWLDDEETSYESWICAYAGTTNDYRSGRECGGAVEVNCMVRSPQFPGAGSTMYALVSSFFGAPITSDRQTSTSNSAKQAWAKIENSSDWSKVELDNYTMKYDPDLSDEYKKWHKFTGSWPSRKVIATDVEGNPEEAGPHTPNDESDDCKLPDAPTPKIINKKLGTADAWQYNGSIDTESLISRGEEAFDEIYNESGFSETDLKSKLITYSNKLFMKYYKGEEG